MQHVHVVGGLIIVRRYPRMERLDSPYVKVRLQMVLCRPRLPVSSREIENECETVGFSFDSQTANPTLSL
jgi:hypothetical protein